MNPVFHTNTLPCSLFVNNEQHPGAVPKLGGGFFQKGVYMTKRDSRIVAQALFQAKDVYGEKSYEVFVEEVAHHLSMHDPRFDIDLFCELAAGREETNG
jgi:hypothetical protein